METRIKRRGEKMKNKKDTNPLQKLRQQAGFSQEEFARKVGISTMSCKRYEYGDRVPDVRTAIRIAKVLGTTVEKLFPSPCGGA